MIEQDTINTQIPTYSIGVYALNLPPSSLIPLHWYSRFTNKRGTPDHDLITILAEILYWYRPRRVTDPSTGKTYYQNKFQGSHWQTSYMHFQRKFGFSHEKVRKALVKLEEKGIIKRIFKNITVNGQKYNNRLFISLNRKFLEETLGNSVSQVQEKSFSGIATCFIENSGSDSNSSNKINHIAAQSETETLAEKGLGVATIVQTQSETIKVQDEYQLEACKNQPKVKALLKSEPEIVITTGTTKAQSQIAQLEIKDNTQAKLAGNTQETIKTTPKTISTDHSNSTLKLFSPPIPSKIDPSPHFRGDHIISNKENIYNLDKIDNNTQDTACGGELSISNFSKKGFDDGCSSSAANSQKTGSRGNHQSKSRIKSLKSSKATKLPFQTPKLLKDFYPLLEKDAAFLRQSSNREFSLHAMNEILKSLIKKLKNRIFYTKQAFLSYMSKVFAHEMRQAALINNSSFRIIAGMSEEEKQDRTKEKYLSLLEQSTDITPDNLFRKRLAALLPKEKAYALLRSLRRIRIDGSTLNLTLSSSKISLSEYEHRLILLQATEIYSETREGAGIKHDLQTLKISFLHNQKTGSNSDFSPLSPFMGIWGKIRQGLINSLNNRGENGELLDRSWFSKLEAEIDEKNKKINLKAPASFIKSWINSNYYSDIRFISDQLGYSFDGIY